MVKILHLASFRGNIGDNASHLGLYNVVEDIFGQFSLTQLEIRRAYFNYKCEDRLVFDQDFIEYANRFDFFVIGGGSFLDYVYPKSKTGTTLDMDPVLIKNLKVPTLISSIGSRGSCSENKNNKGKYKTFLDALFSSNNVSVHIRNDGSEKVLSGDFGKQYLDSYIQVFDNAFFYQNKKAYRFPIEGKYVAINLAPDQIDSYLSMDNGFRREFFRQELKLIVNNIINNLKLNVVFIPHIYNDLSEVSALLKDIDDYSIREKITVAPCIQGFPGARFMFNIYDGSEAVIANRFHANVVAASLKKNVIGLSARPHISALHDSLKSDQAIDLRGSFAQKTNEFLSRGDRIPVSQSLMQRQKEKTASQITQFFGKS